MSKIADEHQSSHIDLQDEQTSLTNSSHLDIEILDDEGNYLDEDDELDEDKLTEIEPVKKSVLPIKTIATVGVLAALIGGISIATKQFKPASSMVGMEDMKGMSMEDMMKVDGAANGERVTFAMSIYTYAAFRG